MVARHSIDAGKLGGRPLAAAAALGGGGGGDPPTTAVAPPAAGDARDEQRDPSAYTGGAGGGSGSGGSGCRSGGGGGGGIGGASSAGGAAGSGGGGRRRPSRCSPQGFGGGYAGAAMAAVLPSPEPPPSPPTTAKVRLGSRDDGSPNIFRLCAQPGCGKNFAVRAAPTRRSVGLPDFDGSYRSCSAKCENMLRVTEGRAAVDYRAARESRLGAAEEDDGDSNDDPLPDRVRRAIKAAMSKGLRKAAQQVAAPMRLTGAYAVAVSLPGGGAFSATDVIISGSKPPPSEAVAAAFRNVLTVAASMPAKLAQEAVAFRSSSAGRARRGTAAAGPAAAAGAIASPLEHHSLATQAVAEASRFADADVAALAETFARERVLRAAAGATMASVADEDEVAALKKAHPGLFMRPVEGLRATQRAIAKAVNDATGGVAAVRKLVDRAVALAERLAQPKKYAAAEAGRANAFRFAAKARGELREAADWAEKSLDALVGREELFKSWKARREDVEDALVAGLELVKDLVAFTDAVRLRLEGPLADMEKAKAKPLPSAASKVGGKKRQRTGGEEGEGEEEEEAAEEMLAAGEDVESSDEERIVRAEVTVPLPRPLSSLLFPLLTPHTYTLFPNTMQFRKVAPKVLVQMKKAAKAKAKAAKPKAARRR